MIELIFKNIFYFIDSRTLSSLWISRCKSHIAHRKYCGCRQSSKVSFNSFAKMALFVGSLPTSPSFYWWWLFLCNNFVLYLHRGIRAFVRMSHISLHQYCRVADKCFSNILQYQNNSHESIHYSDLRIRAQGGMSQSNKYVIAGGFIDPKKSLTLIYNDWL